MDTAGPLHNQPPPSPIEGDSNAHSALPGPSPSWLTALEVRTLPHFNQFVIWILLASGVVLACWWLPAQAGARQAHLVSPLSWLPDAVVASPLLSIGLRLLLLVGCGLWLANRMLPWSCWLVVGSYTAVWSLHVETTTNTAHIFHMANMLLVIQAIWMTADAPLIRQRLADGTFWQLPLVPRWVSLVAIAYIGSFHTAAGLSKLFYSGLAWPTGTSLQLWTHLWGRPTSPTTQLILQSRTLARGLQMLTLVVETSGVLAIVPSLRPWIGLGLLGFYLGVLATFNYGFQLNALLTAIYLLPLERWLTARAAIRTHPTARDPSATHL